MDAVDRAIAAYNEVWDTASPLDASTVETVRRIAMREAIKSLREPTHQMMIAGDRAIEAETDNPSSWEAWRSMIDVSLRTCEMFE